MESTSKIIVEQYTLPAFWACYLINGDLDIYTEEEIETIIRTTADMGNCVQVSEETHFGVYRGMGCDLAEFSFYKH